MKVDCNKLKLYTVTVQEITEKRKNNRANKPMAEVKKWKKSNLGLKKYKIKNEIAYEINRKQ